MHNDFVSHSNKHKDFTSITVQQQMLKSIYPWMFLSLWYGFPGLELLGQHMHIHHFNRYFQAGCFQKMF